MHRAIPNLRAPKILLLTVFLLLAADATLTFLDFVAHALVQLLSIALASSPLAVMVRIAIALALAVKWTNSGPQSGVAQRMPPLNVYVFLPCRGTRALLSSCAVVPACSRVRRCVQVYMRVRCPGLVYESKASSY
eukprot:6182988-Pleurochrysis_carterae.AAC.3